MLLKKRKSILSLKVHYFISLNLIFIIVIEDSFSKDEKEYLNTEITRLKKKDLSGTIPKEDILELLKVIGRVGKTKTKEIRIKHQDSRAKYLKSNSDLYFNEAIKGIMAEEALYNDCMDYVLFSLNISQDNFFNLQSVYMGDSKFCEALTKLDMETLPIVDDGYYRQDVTNMKRRQCKNMMKQLYKDAEKIFDSLYKPKIALHNVYELSPVLFETIAQDLMYKTNGYRMDDILRQATDLKLMDDDDFMEYIQKYQNKLLASVIAQDLQNDVPQ